MDRAQEPTLLSTCSPGIGERCGYVPHYIRNGLELWTLPCRGEPAYEATSSARSDDLRFLVCLQHAPAVRLMWWLSSLRTYQGDVVGA